MVPLDQTRLSQKLVSFLLHNTLDNYLIVKRLQIKLVMEVRLSWRLLITQMKLLKTDKIKNIKTILIIQYD